MTEHHHDIHNGTLPVGEQPLGSSQLLKFKIREKYKPVTIFGWKTPISIREMDKFKSENSLFIIDVKGKELCESFEGQTRCLATLDLKKCRGIPNGLIGKVFLSGGCVIDKQIDECWRHKIVVAPPNEVQWSKVIEFSEKLLIQRDGLTISANPLDRSLENDMVEIECTEPKITLAKILGVLICSDLFNYRSDGGI